jgi:hypothetical protein
MRKEFTMDTTRPYFELSLAARALFEIPDIARVRVTCNRGALWVTLDNDLRDIVLQAGESFSGTEHRRALVFAFEASTMALRPEPDEAVAAHAPSISFESRAAIA